MIRSISIQGLALAALAFLLLLAGCSLIFPPRISRAIVLTPTDGQGGDYRIGEDGSLSYVTAGLRIEVEYMTDRKLNDYFPQESTLGEYSINPYTYGDYVDPAVGYVQNRFTVFRVRVHNNTFAKVELDPSKALVSTNRPGEVHSSFSTTQTPRRQSFESYYRALRGPSGNDYYRYNMRMGLLRSNNYGIDEKVFKGETYDGFIVFDPLDDEVEKVRLHLNDFVLKFNAFNNPIETTDVTFVFDRRQTHEMYDGRATAAARSVSRASLISPSEVRGNIPGDVYREVRNIDAFFTNNLGSINKCFEKEFEAGNAAEGQVAVTFVILPVGIVESAQVASSTVATDAVGECMAELVKRWRFQPSKGLTPDRSTDSEGETGTARQQVQVLIPTRVTVTATVDFLDIRTE